MNNLFSEIFGCYYKVITEIVNNAPLSKEEIIDIINNNGFGETCFQLLPMIDNLPFIEKKDGKYYSRLKNKIKMPLTDIEKSWLKSITEDERYCLFDENENKQMFDDVEKLYEQDVFRYYDKYADGDNYKDNIYRKNFHKINNAIEKCIPVKIIYQSPKKNKITIGHYIPIKLEYSHKNNKFRVYTAKVSDGRIEDYICLNIGRIMDVRTTKEICNQNLEFEKHISIFECDEPITVEIYNERNAIERFMVEFSSYRKNSEYNEEKEICTSQIYYNKTEETEILIRLLSFGPTLKVLAPNRFVELVKQRVQRQKELIKNISDLVN